jgi:hypothetical protein
MLELSLLNERPTLTPMEASRESLEILITMLMLSQQISDSEPETAETMLTISAALSNPAEA